MRVEFRPEKGGKERMRVDVKKNQEFCGMKWSSEIGSLGNWKDVEESGGGMEGCLRVLRSPVVE